MDLACHLELSELRSLNHATNVGGCVASFAKHATTARLVHCFLVCRSQQHGALARRSGGQVCIRQVLPGVRDYTSVEASPSPRISCQPAPPSPPRPPAPRHTHTQRSPSCRSIKHHTRTQHAAPSIACGSREDSGRVLLSDVPSPLREVRTPAADGRQARWTRLPAPNISPKIDPRERMPRDCPQRPRTAKTSRGGGPSPGC
jgi:hypothetical protein